jgi:flagellar FliJ protein
MATPSALETLIELATKDTDEAAKRLGRAIRAAESEQQKLQLLQQYRDEYAARLQANAMSGLSISGYRNFQFFLDKLEEAIKGQRKVIADVERRVSSERAAWQISERKRMSYGTLANRAMGAELQQQARREQKQTDEFASRKLLYRR